MSKKTVGQLLREARGNLQLYVAAQELGISQAFLSMAEAGTRHLKLDTLRAAIKLYGVDPVPILRAYAVERAEIYRVLEIPVGNLSPDAIGRLYDRLHAA